MALPADATSEQVDAVALELYRLHTNTHDALCDAMRHLAHVFARRVDLVTLVSDGDPHSLAIHTEGIYRPVPPQYFMLGCVHPSAIGGNTIVYDPRKAARLVRHEGQQGTWLDGECVTRRR